MFFLTILSFIPNAVAAEELKIQDNLPIMQSYSIPIYDSIISTDSGVQVQALKKVADVNYHLNPQLSRIYYNVVMRPGYSFLSFKGEIRITNLTTGFFEGEETISGIKGSIPVPT